ncbi:hypothetical protein H6P81_005637 [Aristolochia fimbriata]|uniref:Uncharacterized protein n=1 Tax=Aristolochia fimbriata TaxID=158543 RepID=A0AAV7EZJ2_ARIFI|nr:hypothetical protein H6P81_005637 [Aristolochia fimbriata]
MCEETAVCEKKSLSTSPVTAAKVKILSSCRRLLLFGANSPLEITGLAALYLTAAGAIMLQTLLNAALKREDSQSAPSLNAVTFGSRLSKPREKRDPERQRPRFLWVRWTSLGGASERLASSDQQRASAILFGNKQ